MTCLISTRKVPFRKPGNFTKVFRRINQSFQANIMRVPQINASPSPFTSFPIHYLLSSSNSKSHIVSW